MLEEALMLTGDENIVDINFTVFWVINDAKAYLFNIRDPDLRGIGGRKRDARGRRRNPDRPGVGRRARQDRGPHPKTAAVDPRQLWLRDRDHLAAAAAGRPARRGHRRLSRRSGGARRPRPAAQRSRDLPQRHLPGARGDAVQIEQQAAAYRLATVARAQGDASRFLSVYQRLQGGQDVTSERLYLETMEQVLKNSNKVIIDKSAQGGNGVLPYLPLPALGGGGASRPPRAPSAPVRGPGIGVTQPNRRSIRAIPGALPPSSGQ